MLIDNNWAGESAHLTMCSGLMTSGSVTYGKLGSARGGSEHNRSIDTVRIKGLAAATVAAASHYHLRHRAKLTKRWEMGTKRNNRSREKKMTVTR